MSANLMLAYTAFVIGVASPGPSTLAVMGVAMARGRARALALAAGIVSGSLCWGLAAAFGLAALMTRWSAALALPADARQTDALAFVGSCVLLSATIFSGYALAFSTGAARRGYRAVERPVNALLAGVFAYAGLRMLMSSR